jgi:hypothetical protein
LRAGQPSSKPGNSAQISSWGRIVTTDEPLDLSGRTLARQVVTRRSVPLLSYRRPCAT